MVSEDIQARKEEFMAIMRAHGTMSRDAIAASVGESQARLLETFRSAPSGRDAQSPAEGEWSLRELALHAAFTERLIAQLVHHLARSSTPPREAFDRAGIGMMPEDDGRGYDAALAELERMNVELIGAVRALPDAPDIEMKLPHPFFGPLNCKEWAGFQRVHDLDHIQHAEKILAVVRT